MFYWTDVEVCPNCSVLFYIVYLFTFTYIMVQLNYMIVIHFKWYSTMMDWNPVAENASESERKDLLSELELMKQLKPHPYIIKLLGCVAKSGKY